MDKSIFDFEDYRVFLGAWIKAQLKGGRGMRAALAQKLQCHRAYISLVLNRKANFSLEQTELLAEFMALSEDESDFLFLLVQKERAGSKNLEQRFLQKLKEAKELQLRLTHRMRREKQISEKDQAIFFSEWYYSVILLLCGMEAFQTREAIAARLHLSMTTINKALSFLQSIGFIEQKGDRFLRSHPGIFLRQESPFINTHHGNWRLQAMQSLGKRGAHDFHYSGAATIGAADIVKLRKVFVDSIERATKLIGDSQEEDVVGICVDLFQIMK